MAESESEMTFPGSDEKWMKQAIDLAEAALSRGEFPVACVLVSGGRVASAGVRSHTIEGDVNELDHAEIHALRKWIEGGRTPGHEAEGGLSAYCTLEPCLMCLGALVLNGVKRVVYAYEDVMGGAAGLDLSAPLSAAAGASGMSSAAGENLYAAAGLEITAGVMRRESLALFKKFFSDPSNSYWEGSPLSAYTLGA